MKRLILLISALIILEQIAISAQQVNVYMNVNFDARAAFITAKFKETLPLNPTEVMYTKVPRGLIVSIPEEKFFQKGSTQLTDEGKTLLQAIGVILKSFTNKCAIESHTEEPLDKSTGYKEDWEISIHRANVLTRYLITCCKIETLRLYPIGFGNTMPFNDNVSSQKFPNNRVDFVIFDYYVRR